MTHGQLLELNNKRGVALGRARGVRAITFALRGPHTPDQRSADFVLTRPAQYTRFALNARQAGVVWVIVGYRHHVGAQRQRRVPPVGAFVRISQDRYVATA